MILFKGIGIHPGLINQISHLNVISLTN